MKLTIAKKTRSWTWEQGSPLYEIVSRYSKFWINCIFHIHETNWRKNPPTGGSLFVVSHSNYGMDGIIHGLVEIPTPIFVIAKSSLLKIPVLGPFLKRCGVLPIHRKRDAAETSKNVHLFQSYADHVSAGKKISIYPEGTCDDFLKLKPIKNGISRIINFVIQADGRCVIEPVFIFYHERENLFSQIDVYKFEEIHLANPVEEKVFPAQLRQTMWNLQFRLYEQMREFIFKEFGFSIDVERLIYLHEQNHEVIRDIIALIQKPTRKDYIFGILSCALIPFTLFVMPLLGVCTFVARFAVDRSEKLTYRFVSFTVLLPIYLILIWSLLNFKVMLMTILGIVSLRFSNNAWKLFSVIFKKRFKKMVRHWIVKASK